MRKRLELVISGRVQGIFFRQFVKENALKLNLVGMVENKTDGTVHTIAEGESNKLLKLLELCKSGPRLAKVKNIRTNWSNPTDEFKEFIINY